MGQIKLCLTVADFGRARQLSDRLGEAWEPAAHAVTLFEVAAAHSWEVEAYYDVQPDSAALMELLTGLLDDPAALRFEAIPDENWVAISQAALPPVTAGRFVVHGSHDRIHIGFRLNAIEIDAGEAFGTAHHATTRGCLEALDRLVHRQRFRRVLDLGCGSGVLAIAARRLMPRARIIASDIDAEAVRVARSNARNNRVGSALPVVASVGFRHPALRGASRFDLILANILAGPLIGLAPAMRRAIAPRGVAVLSGILDEQAAEVEAAFRTVGFSILEKRIEAGWATLVLVRRP
ncbi:MAG: 50S ribosomal protein L11 methyltransferase [Hyphomicrobiaceae bacterium]